MPLLIAPAMNDRMYDHPATQANLDLLRARGAIVLEPEAGWLACRQEGRGRLTDLDCLVAAVAQAVSGGELKGLRVLVTAGPTREPLDPVRFLSNRSSGKMGYALAAVAARRGAQVTLISGPTSLTPPTNCEVVRVQTAQEMLEAVLARGAEQDVIIGAAAPADYSPAEAAKQKLKRTKDELTVTLKATTDIIAECGRCKRQGQFVVAFAAETQDLLDNARRKLAEKQADLIVANDVSGPDLGMEAERNAAVVLFPSGQQVEIPAMDKYLFAERVWEIVAASLPSAR